MEFYREISKQPMTLVDPHLRTPQPPRNYAADEPMHPLQIERYRRMTFAEKLDALAQLYWSGREWMAAGTRMRHPNWSEEEVQREVRLRMLYGVS